MSQKQLALVVAGALVLVAALVIMNQGSPSSDPVRIGYLRITASLPLFIAQEEGYFEEEGVEVETVQLTTSNQLVDGVAAGNVDLFIESSAVPVLALEAQSPGRLKVFAVSAITEDAPFDSLLVRPDSNIQGLADLEGKTVGVFPGSTATRLLQKFLDDKGVDTRSMNFVPIPPPNQLTALVQGSIDALHAYEPTTAFALSGARARQIHGSVYAEMISPNPQGVAAASSSFLSDRADDAASAIRALERAMDMMRSDDDRAREIMATTFELDDQVASRSVFLYMVPHDEIDTASFQEYADMLYAMGELPTAVDAGALVLRQ